MNMEAIEIWPDYITPVHEYVYDAIHICNAEEFFTLQPKKHFDLIFMGDVIEHMPLAKW